MKMIFLRHEPVNETIETPGKERYIIAKVPSNRCETFYRELIVKNVSHDEKKNALHDKVYFYDNSKNNYIK
jgi:hypothetical protein